jgi:hypothetical protein
VLGVVRHSTSVPKFLALNLVDPETDHTMWLPCFFTSGECNYKPYHCSHHINLYVISVSLKEPTSEMDFFTVVVRHRPDRLSRL